MKIVNLRWRETMKLKARIFCAQGPQEIFVPFDAEVRVQASLHKDAGAAERDGFIDLFADFVYRAHIGIRRAGAAIEGAEGADHVADVGVVDIAVDDISDDVVRMMAPAN